MHAHHYLQYGICGSASIELKTPDWAEPQKARSFFIPSDVSHQVRLEGKDPVLMVWLDPEFQLNRTLSNAEEIQVSLRELETELGQLINRPLDCPLACRIRSVITGRPVSSTSRRLDERVSAARTWIEQHLSGQTITVEELAANAYLSPSRFMHLFSQEIGIPVRKYILWQRLRRTLLLMVNSVSITEAAHGAGFTDSSHMNRTFNAMFGITPAKIFKNSRFVQVIAC